MASTLDTIHYEQNLITQIQELERRLNALERTELSGVVGPQGPTGATGAQGPAGPGTPAGAAQGDVIYFDATPEAVVLNIGAAEQVLRVNAGATAPEWASIDNDSIANRTRVFLVDAVGCYDATGAGQQNRVWRGWQMADAVQSECYGGFRVPADFASGLTVNVIFESPSAGDCRIDLHWYMGAVGESYTAHSSNTGVEDKTIAANTRATMTSNGSLAAATTSDYVLLKCTRYGNHANDTVGNTVNFCGFIVSYTADM